MGKARRGHKKQLTKKCSLLIKLHKKVEKKRMGLQDEQQTGVQQTGITNGVIKLVQGGFPQKMPNMYFMSQ